MNELTLDRKIESINWVIKKLQERRNDDRDYICLRFKDWYWNHVWDCNNLGHKEIGQVFPELLDMIDSVGKKLSPKTYYWGDAWRGRDNESVRLSFRVKKLNKLIKEIQK